MLQTFKQAFGGLSRSVWLLALTQLINRSGTMVIFFLSVYLHSSLGIDIEHVGILMAIFGAGSLTGVFIGGRLIDKIGYYPIMLFSLMAGGIMFFLVSLLRDPLLLGIGLFFLSALGESFRPANMASISFYSKPENYTRSVSLNRLAINLGFAVGPVMGGILATINYSYIFWADGITCIGASAIVFFLLENKHRKFASEIKKKEVSISPYTDKIYLLFLVLVALYGTAFFQLFSIMPLYYKEVEMLSESQIGWLMAINGLIVAGVEMVMIYKLEKKASHYNLIALGALLLAISYFALIWVHGFTWLVILIVIISFSEMFAMPFMNTFMNNRSQGSNKGQYTSLFVMAWSIAQIATPIISTRTIANFGYDGLWKVFIVFSLVVAFGIKLIGKKVESQ